MTFQFTLQKILNLREQETEDAETKVEYAKKIIFELKKMIHEERDLYFSDRDDLNKYALQAQIHKVKLFENSLRLRQDRIMELLDNLRTCQSDLEVYQQALIQCRRNQKILENLKDLKQKEYYKVENRKEQALLDELGNQKFVRMQMQEKDDE
ncbi:flagellar export protein FliJ [Silvanigrella aquatica]|uniref:Flagellar FliJ protein n=1 Tax=Silvanigrella aquatica TaxID=1915309 RepID=A0A1L4CZR9_9BACT|nr:flagellar export protein FliJ [Silvanigrella aquatica]APJ03427.1 flagellar export protein FliJ [Silvanigrella aquatica]